jgi:hypothetical protein
MRVCWKREGKDEHRRGWRIKIPLSGIDWEKSARPKKPGTFLAANVIGRRPHAAEPINWRIETLLSTT